MPKYPPVKPLAYNTARVWLATWASNLSRRVRSILARRIGKMTLGLSIVSVITMTFVGCLELPTAGERKANQEKGASTTMGTSEQKNLAAHVKRENGKVWLDGVKGFSPAEYADSVHGSQALILRTIGESLNYDDLICYSGFAFRIGMHEGMCPSAGHPCCGYECMDNGYRALPWKTKIYESLPWDKEKQKEDRVRFEAEVCAAIKQSIDRGIPVQYGGEEDGIIVGYADEGRRWWCFHPYHEWGAEPFWHDEAKGFAGGKWPWAVVIWQQPKPADQRVPERDLTIAALKQAVQMWHTEKREKAYFCGEAAYAHWLNWLRGVDSGKVKDPKAGMQGNGWCYNVLEHSRGIAGRWLKQRAQSFRGEARARLLAAANHYSRITELCMEGLDEPWQLALSPDKLDRWTPDMRRTQIQRLEAAREHDRAAIAEIGKALRAYRAAQPDNAGGTE